MSFSKKIRFSLLSLSLIGLISIVFVIVRLDLAIKQKKEDSKIFHQAEPTDLEFYQTVYGFNKTKIVFENSEIVGGVIPHHLLAGDMIAEFYSNLEGQEVDTVILLGPNHFNSGEGKIISSFYNWKTPFGEIEADREVIARLKKYNSEIKIDEAIFLNEHAINSQVAFIKKTFPDARLVPLVLRADIGPDEASNLADSIKEISQGKKILVLASVDFSHYKDSQTAQANDEISLQAISDFAYEKIYDLDIDSPASIYALAWYSNFYNSKFKVLKNSNSALLSGKNDVDSTTSYATGYFLKEKISLNHLPENEIKPISMLFFGDIMLDRHVGERIKEKGLDYILEKLAGEEKGFFNGRDLISANLEGAVTDGGAHYRPEMGNDFAFAPDLVGKLQTDYNFNFFNLANNHFSDQGERGIIETRKNLDALGLSYSGCEDKKTGECSAEIIKIADRKIALLGFSMVYGLLDEEAVAEKVLENKKLADLVIVNIHWGVEYDHKFNPTQQKLAHKLIDAGADIIIGHHPHVVQGMEIYKDKPIFYSLGNFIFDQYFSIDTQEGLGIGLNFSDKEIVFDLFPIKSEKSQVRLMNPEEKQKFFDKFVKWSELDSILAESVKIGELVLKHESN